MKNDFEYQVNKLVSYINKNELGFAWKNHPCRLHDGKYIEGEPFDYIFLTKKAKCVFDCKETHSDKYNILPKDIKQAHNLLACTISPSIESFFLIYFYKYKTYRKLDINNFFEILSQRKYIKFEDCQKINMLGIVK